MLGVEVDIWFGKGRRDAFKIRTDIVVGSSSRSSSAEVETSSSRVDIWYMRSVSASTLSSDKSHMLCLSWMDEFLPCARYSSGSGCDKFKVR